MMCHHDTGHTTKNYKATRLPVVRWQDAELVGGLSAQLLQPCVSHNKAPALGFRGCSGFMAMLATSAGNTSSSWGWLQSKSALPAVPLEEFPGLKKTVLEHHPSGVGAVATPHLSNRLASQAVADHIPEGHEHV